MEKADYVDRCRTPYSLQEKDNKGAAVSNDIGLVRNQIDSYMLGDIDLNKGSLLFGQT